jgi:hypothetical protein
MINWKAPKEKEESPSIFVMSAIGFFMFVNLVSWLFLPLIWRSL